MSIARRRTFAFFATLLAAAWCATACRQPHLSGNIIVVGTTNSATTLDPRVGIALDIADFTFLKNLYRQSSGRAAGS